MPGTHSAHREPTESQSVFARLALPFMFNPDLGIWLFIFSYILVGFLFELHHNPKE